MDQKLSEYHKGKNLHTLCSLLGLALGRAEEFLPLPATETTLLQNVTDEFMRLDSKMLSQMPGCLSPRKLRLREDVDVEIYRLQKRAAEVAAKNFAERKKGDEGRTEK